MATVNAQQHTRMDVPAEDSTDFLESNKEWRHLPNELKVHILDLVFGEYYKTFNSTSRNGDTRLLTYKLSIQPTPSIPACIVKFRVNPIFKTLFVSREFLRIGQPLYGKNAYIEIADIRDNVARLRLTDSSIVRGVLVTLFRSLKIVRLQEQESNAVYNRIDDLILCAPKLETVIIYADGILFWDVSLNGLWDCFRQEHQLPFTYTGQAAPKVFSKTELDAIATSKRLPFDLLRLCEYLEIEGPYDPSGLAFSLVASTMHVVRDRRIPLQRRQWDNTSNALGKKNATCNTNQH